jgi:hypothetical protein
MTLGPFFFAAPWALGALAALPVLIWLLRATPPAPRQALFPPLRLLLGIQTEEESRERAPWWLILVRALIAALLILGFARPSLAPDAETGAGSATRTLIVIDNGWTSAPGWAGARAAAEAAAAESERAQGQVRLLATASAPSADAASGLSGADARARIARLKPLPWRPDRAAAEAALKDYSGDFTRIIWIADGLNDQGAESFGRALAGRGPVIVKTPGQTARAVTNVAAGPEGLAVEIRRGPGGGGAGAVAAETAEGRSLAATPFTFEPGQNIATAVLKLPPEIAARTARVRLVGEDSAAAVRLMPRGAARPLVGLVDPAAEGGQTLLNDLYYVERAIQPFATARRGTAKDLIGQGAQVLVLADVGSLPPADAEAIARWLDTGGLLVRFAGPRLANDQDDLLPGPIRPGARALGGALAWDQPQALATFPADGPFGDLTPPDDVAVRRQVLIEPTAERDVRVWARLADGAPVVTAAAREQGLIVLFHFAAGPGWSDVPLSGLYVDMLRRTLAFAGRPQGADEARDVDEPWRPVRLVDGYGALRLPDADSPLIPQDRMRDAPVAGPEAPPGLYERAGGETLALDAARREEPLAALSPPPGAQTAGFTGERPFDLAGPLLTLAAVLAALDLALALALTGKLPAPPRLRLRGGAAALLAAVLAAAGADQAAAQTSPIDLDPTRSMRLAYVRTGDARLDRLTESGLAGLSRTLNERTSVEPGPPIGLDPARDDLSPYPILYWAAPDTPTRLSDAAAQSLDAYMRLGGLLFVDTRDAGSGANAASPAAVLLQGLDAPPLEQVGEDHVLTKAFYLMRNFPGRRRGAVVWAESPGAAAARDGVASLMVGDGDWAAAWAVDDRGQPIGADGRQRELALRFGVNLVMVALTGNYKADQVHVPALLERMGEEPRPRGRRSGGRE